MAEGIAISDISMELPEAKANPELLQRCKRICDDFRLSAADLNFEWDLLTLNSKSKRMTLEALSELEERVSAQASKRMKVEGGKGAKQQFGSRTQAATFNKDTAHLLGAQHHLREHHRRILLPLTTSLCRLLPLPVL